MVSGIAVTVSCACAGFTQVNFVVDGRQELCGKTCIMGIVNSEPHKDAHMVTLYKACVRPSQ